MNRIAYIAGPMTGFHQYNKSNFNKAERRLKELKIHNKIINPGRLIKQKSFIGADYMDFLTQDIKDLLTATDMFLLEGWGASRGVKIELLIAERLKMRIWEFDKNWGYKLLR